MRNFASPNDVSGEVMSNTQFATGIGLDRSTEEMPTGGSREAIQTAVDSS
jgi:hypothetical protein